MRTPFSEEPDGPSPGTPCSREGFAYQLKSAHLGPAQPLAESYVLDRLGPDTLTAYKREMKMQGQRSTRIRVSERESIEIRRTQDLRDLTKGRGR